MMIEQYRTEVRPFIDAYYPFQVRQAFVEQYSWAIPTPEALSLIASFGDVVEIGSGGGYWAWMLEEYFGVRVACFEAKDFRERWRHIVWKRPDYAEPEVAAQYPDRTLFMCWPPYDHPMAYRAAMAYLRAGGRRIAYVGEPGNGCTGCRRFARLQNFLHEVADAPVLQWAGMHDHLMIYERQQR
jgi:hypothetical protein